MNQYHRNPMEAGKINSKGSVNPHYPLICLAFSSSSRNVRKTTYALNVV